VDHEFLGLLNEDFGIDFFSLNKAFMGVPAAPKRQAIPLCEWVIKTARGDTDEAGRALRAWAKKNGKGLHNKRLVEAPRSRTRITTTCGASGCFRPPRSQRDSR